MLLVILGPPGPASRGTCPRPSACNSWSRHETHASVHPLTCHTARAGHAFATKVSPNTFCDVFLHGPPPIRLQGVRQLHTAHSNEVCQTASAVQQSVHDEGFPGGQIATSGVAREWVPSCQKNLQSTCAVLSTKSRLQHTERGRIWEQCHCIYTKRVDSMPPWGGRTGNFYIKRTPDGRRPVLYISPGTFEGAVRVPKDCRAAPLSTATRPSRFFTRIGRKSCGACPATGRSPHGTPRVPPRAFYGLSTA